MAVTLDMPISWISADGDDAAMLDSLQPNILKPHAREIFTALFVKFHDRTQAVSLLRELATDGIVPALMKSALTHLAEVREFKATGTTGTPYVGVGLTAAGYDALGIDTDRQPADPAFQRGMTNHETQALLLDPDVDDWDGYFLQEVHAVILVGDQNQEPHNAALARVREMIAARPGIVPLGEQAGKGLRNGNKEGIEHFGYVDGRSQPLFFEEDIEGEPRDNWDPAFALGRAIVSDVAAPDPAIHFGSYFVFRKLEQNVQRFKTLELKLADDLKLDDHERAGAMLVGRFEDGTPLTSRCTDGDHDPIPNDFNYDKDEQGGKCPFLGHIRKMNPRGSGGFEDHEGERLHIMPRRGQTYGDRYDDPNDGETDNKPVGGVGLLFMAFNASLTEQFEFVQINWANNMDFPRVNSGIHPPGLDIVIGHGDRPDIECPRICDAQRSDAADWGIADAPKQTVTMKGGEYFFMPSLAFLQNVGGQAG